MIASDAEEHSFQIPMKQKVVCVKDRILQYSMFTADRRMYTQVLLRTSWFIWDVLVVCTYVLVVALSCNEGGKWLVVEFAPTGCHFLH